jgi:hypothetical protein
MTATGLPTNEYLAAESKSPAANRAESSPCSALDCLLNDLLDFYVSTEKVYWHFRLAPAAIDDASGLPEQLAGGVCGKALEAMSLIMQLKCILDHIPDQECAELMAVDAAKQSELRVLQNQAKETAGS